MVAHTSNPSYSGGVNRRITVQTSLEKDPIQKITKAKKTGDLIQV
jgi:hypothetical protein